MSVWLLVPVVLLGWLIVALCVASFIGRCFALAARPSEWDDDVEAFIEARLEEDPS